MPEGDSLHNLATRLTPALLNREIKSFTARRIADDVAKTLIGRRAISVSARGKNLLVRFDDDRVLHIHLKMEGRVFIERPRSAFYAPRPPNPHPELRIVMSSGAVIVGSRLPICRLLTATQEKRAPDLQNLGPDLCDEAFATSAALQDDAIRRVRTLFDGDNGRGGTGSIAEALLFQRAAAGIGNVYKSEVLFLEQIDPRSPARRIDDASLRRLFVRASILLRRNLQNGPRTTRFSLTGPRLWVYERAGKPCLRCAQMGRSGATIVMIHQALRSTYFCPECQDVSREQQQGEPESTRPASS